MRFYLLLLLMLPFYMVVQSSEVDSLLRLLPTLNDPAEKSEVLNSLCLKMMYSRPDSALLFGEQALHIGKSNNDFKIVGKAFNRIGIVYDVKNVWDSALMFYDSALVYSRIVNDTITQASAYNNIGLVYWNKSYYDKATENFFLALKFFEILGSDKGVANIYNNIGLIFMEQGRDALALQYQKKGLKLREKIGDEYGIHDSKLNIAMLYTVLELHDSSLLYFREVIPFYEKTGNHYALGTAYTDMTLYFLSNKALDSAMYYSDKSIQEYQEVHSNYRVITSMLNKASIYRETGDVDQELKILSEAYDIIDEESPLKTKVKVIYQLAKGYYKKGQYKKAGELFIEYKAANDSLYNLERDEKIEEINVKYETEKKEKELLFRKAENERLAKEKALIELAVFNRNKWIVGISSLSVIFILLVFALQQRKKRKIQAMGDAAIIEEREKGLKAVFDAQEEERQRIAKDLHDGIGQQISAIRLHIQNFAQKFVSNENQSGKSLEKISKMIKDTGAEIREVSHRMMPRALTELGLIDALEDMIDKSFTHSDIHCTFDHHGIAERLPVNVEIGLYRIAQELVNNIIKHSGAQQVDIQLMKTGTHCIFIVQDNGKGMGSANPDGGIGMQNINNRLRTLNGELNMESYNGMGTTATIRIALT